MSLGPLLSAPPPIPWHAFAALAALVIGGAQLALPKGTTRHRVMGYAWAALMLVIAISSFWIQQIRLIGPFSPIHILSMLVLVTAPLAVWYARGGHQAASHCGAMIKHYVFTLVGAGIVMLRPGRIIHACLRKEECSESSRQMGRGPHLRRRVRQRPQTGSGNREGPEGRRRARARWNWC